MVKPGMTGWCQANKSTPVGRDGRLGLASISTLTLVRDEFGRLARLLPSGEAAAHARPDAPGERKRSCRTV